MINPHHTDDHDIQRIRRAYQAGMTLSKAAKYLLDRYQFDNNVKLIKEWRFLKKTFGCQSLPMHVYNNYRYYNTEIDYNERELNTFVSPLCGSYANWKGIMGPGKQLRDMLATENTQ